MNSHDVPPPGREAIVTLGEHETRVRVRVLSEVKRRVVKDDDMVGSIGGVQGYQSSSRVVLVEIPGQRPFDVAIERFVESCTDYRL